jgi:RNA polymerase sigma factor (sigma-70 family)
MNATTSTAGHNISSAGSAGTTFLAPANALGGLPASKRAAGRSHSESDSALAAADAASAGADASAFFECGVPPLSASAAVSGTAGAALGFSPAGSDDDEDSVKAWWRHAQSFPLLSGEEEVALARRIEAGDEVAFNRMVECNLRLVANIARKCRRFAGTTLQMCDLTQEGCIGLMRAARKFDYRKGYKFSTYASYWIRQAVMRAIAERARSVRLPVHMVEAVSRAERARTILTHELQRPPSLREIALYLQIPEARCAEILDRASEPMSLDAGMGDEDDSALADFIVDVRAQAPEDNAALQALKREIREALEGLPAREARVIALRYGLDGSNSARTLDEVGAVMDLTRERIRQIEKSAIRQLRSCPALLEICSHHSTLSYSGHTTVLA